jgi:hypothetical protein
LFLKLLLLLLSTFLSVTTFLLLPNLSAGGVSAISVCWQSGYGWISCLSLLLLAHLPLLSSCLLLASLSLLAFLLLLIRRYPK